MDGHGRQFHDYNFRHAAVEQASMPPEHIYRLVSSLTPTAPAGLRYTAALHHAPQLSSAHASATAVATPTQWYDGNAPTDTWPTTTPSQSGRYGNLASWTHPDSTKPLTCLEFLLARKQSYIESENLAQWWTDTEDAYVETFREEPPDLRRAVSGGSKAGGSANKNTIGWATSFKMKMRERAPTHAFHCLDLLCLRWVRVEKARAEYQYRINLDSDEEQVWGAIDETFEPSDEAVSSAVTLKPYPDRQDQSRKRRRADLTEPSGDEMERIVPHTDIWPAAPPSEASQAVPDTRPRRQAGNSKSRSSNIQEAEAEASMNRVTQISTKLQAISRDLMNMRGWIVTPPGWQIDDDATSRSASDLLKEILPEGKQPSETMRGTAGPLELETYSLTDEIWEHMRFLDTYTKRWQAKMKRTNLARSHKSDASQLENINNMLAQARKKLPHIVVDERGGSHDQTEGDLHPVLLALEAYADEVLQRAAIVPGVISRAVEANVMYRKVPKTKNDR